MSGSQIQVQSEESWGAWFRKNTYVFIGAVGIVTVGAVAAIYIESGIQNVPNGVLNFTGCGTFTVTDNTFIDTPVVCTTTGIWEGKFTGNIVEITKK